MNTMQAEIHDIRCELLRHIKQIEQKDTISLDFISEGLEELSKRLDLLSGGAELDAADIKN